MTDEIELAFITKDENTIDKIIIMIIENSGRVKELDKFTQHNIYFDFKDESLLKNGTHIRLRGNYLTYQTTKRRVFANGEFTIGIGRITNEGIEVRAELVKRKIGNEKEFLDLRKKICDTQLDDFLFLDKYRREYSFQHIKIEIDTKISFLYKKGIILKLLPTVQLSIEGERKKPLDDCYDILNRIYEEYFKEFGYIIHANYFTRLNLLRDNLLREETIDLHKQFPIVYEGVSE